MEVNILHDHYTLATPIYILYLDVRPKKLFTIIFLTLKKTFLIEFSF